MKRRWLAMTLAAGLILALLTGCGGSASNSAMSGSSSSSSSSMGGMWDGATKEESATMDSMVSTAPMEAPETEMSAGSTTSKEQRADEKLIYTAHLNMETTSFDETIARVESLTDSMDGYYESSSISNWRNGYRNANYTVRIPADRYDAFLSQVGELCHLTNKEEYTENVTEAYYDVEGRLTTQRTKLERLQTLLAQAESMEDIITIESAISETEWQIENLSGTLRHYDALVDYATVHINISEVYQLSSVEKVPDSFGERMGDAFSEGMIAFSRTLENWAVSFAYSWMWWLALAVVVFVVVRVVRKGRLPKVSFRRKKKGDKIDGE